MLYRTGVVQKIWGGLGRPIFVSTAPGNRGRHRYGRNTLTPASIASVRTRVSAVHDYIRKTLPEASEPPAGWSGPCVFRV
jgi:hypothetical protein